jgi:hypothetical protein
MALSSAGSEKKEDSFLELLKLRIHIAIPDYK